MKPVLYIVALSFFLFPLASYAKVDKAASLQNLDEKSKIYTIGIEDKDYYPYFYHEGNSFAGIFREILDAYTKKSKFNFSYEPLPITRNFESQLTGAIDFKFPDNPYWLKKLRSSYHIFYSDGILEYTDGVVRRTADLGTGIKTLKILGTYKSFSPIQYDNLIDKKKIKVIYSDSLSSLVNMLIHKRIDGIYLNVEVVRIYLVKNKLQHLAQFDKKLPYKNSYYMISTIKYPNVIEDFNKFINSNSKLLSNIKKKYKIVTYKGHK